MKTLKEEDVIRIMREEWNSKVARVLQEAGIDAKVDFDDDDKQESVLSPDLKVRHTDSGVLYTIDSVGPRDVILKTPEGKLMLVDNATLEDEYEIA